jgi:hypothetical protein
MQDVLIILLMLLLFFVTLWMVPGLTRLMGR